METKDSTKTFITVMTVISVTIITLIIIGFCTFITREPEVVEEEENGGSIIISYPSKKNGVIRLKELKPVKDEDMISSLKEGEYYDFGINVNFDVASLIEYDIAIAKEKTDSTIPDDDIRIYLEKEINGHYTNIFGPAKFTPLKDNSEYKVKNAVMDLYRCKKNNSKQDNYRLRVWLSDKASVQSGDYAIEILVNGKAG